MHRWDPNTLEHGFLNADYRFIIVKLRATQKVSADWWVLDILKSDFNSRPFLYPPPLCLSVCLSVSLSLSLSPLINSDTDHIT